MLSQQPRNQTSSFVFGPLYLPSLALVLIVIACFMAGTGSASLPNGGLSMYEISTRPWLYNLTLKYL